MQKDTSKVKAILFDLDNTLIDFMKMKQHAINSAVEAMIDAGLPKGKEEVLKIIDRLYKKYGIEYQKIFDDVLTEILGKVDFKILAAGVVAYRKVKEGYIEPYPNVTSTLVELVKRGYNIGIISDAHAFQVWTRLVGMNLHHLFNFVITFEETGVGKPDELPFRLALEKLNLKPEEVVMIGDDIKKDIKGAKKFGIITILAKYGEMTELIKHGYITGIRPESFPTKVDRKSDEQKPDFEISDIKEILDLLPKKVD